MTDAYLRLHPNPNLRQYRSPRRQEPSGVIGVHTAENAPDAVATDGGAEAVARFISTRSDPGSYHELVDSDSFINLVRWEDEAWHDGTGTNPHSFGLSFATTAAWWPFAPKAWRDGAITQGARRAAAYAKWLKARSGIIIPPRRISAAEARRRVPGFVTHAELDPGRRTDPGAGFPFEQFLAEFAILTTDKPAPEPDPPLEDTNMALAYRFADGKVWLCSAFSRRHVLRQELNELAVVGLVAPVPAGDPNRDDQWIRKAPREAEKILSRLPVAS